MRSAVMRDLRAVSREKNAPSGHRRAIGDPVSSTPALPASLRARNRCRGVRAHLAPRPENSPEFLTPRNRPSLRRWRAASALGLGDDAGSVLARREGLALRKRRRRASERASPEVREARWFATRRWAVSFLFAQRETRATSSRRFRASLGPGCPGQHPNRPRSRFACAIIPTTVGYQQPVGYSCPACEDVRRRPAARAQSRRRRRLARWHVPARPSPRASPCSRRAFSRARRSRRPRPRPPPRRRPTPRRARRRSTRATTARRSSRSPRSPRASPWASSRASPSTRTRACAWSRAAASSSPATADLCARRACTSEISSCASSPRFPRCSRPRSRSPRAR